MVMSRPFGVRIPDPASAVSGLGCAFAGWVAGCSVPLTKGHPEVSARKTRGGALGDSTYSKVIR